MYTGLVHVKKTTGIGIEQGGIPEARRGKNPALRQKPDDKREMALLSLPCPVLKPSRLIDEEAWQFATSYVIVRFSSCLVPL